MLKNQLVFILVDTCAEPGTLKETSNGVCQCQANFKGYKCDQCDEGYTGQGCDQCEEGYFKVENKCQACRCASFKSDGTCDQFGQCNCLPNFAGMKCNGCKHGHVGKRCNQCAPRFFMTDSGECEGKASKVILLI